MQKQGWIVDGSGSAVAVIEKRIAYDQFGFRRLTSYSEAKDEALRQLRDFVEPYLERIAQIEADEFAKLGRFPPLKAWQYGDREKVVVAASKIRARELATESKYYFDSYWRSCDGWWWYRLAHEEGMWIEERDENRKGTGVYYRPLDRIEADEIAEQHLEVYRTKSLDHLISLVGQKPSFTGISSQGTPYRVTVAFEIYESLPEVLAVRVEVDDCLQWRSGGWASFRREIPAAAFPGLDQGRFLKKNAPPEAGEETYQESQAVSQNDRRPKKKIALPFGLFTLDFGKLLNRKQAIDVRHILDLGYVKRYSSEVLSNLS